MGSQILLQHPWHSLRNFAEGLDVRFVQLPERCQWLAPALVVRSPEASFNRQWQLPHHCSISGSGSKRGASTLALPISALISLQQAQFLYVIMGKHNGTQCLLFRDLFRTCFHHHNGVFGTATVRSKQTVALPRVGFTYSPFTVTLIPATGPARGYQRWLRQRWPQSAPMVGELLLSTDMTVTTTCTSLRNPSETEPQRTVNHASGQKSLLRWAVLPAAIRRSFPHGVHALFVVLAGKSIPWRLLLMVAVTKTTVSPYHQTEPLACFATSPPRTRGRPQPDDTPMPYYNLQLCNSSGPY